MLLVAVATALITALGVYFAYLTYRQGNEAPYSGPSVQPPSDPNVTSTATNSGPSASQPRPTADTACWSRATGQPTDCYSDDAALEVSAHPCDITGVFGAWGLDPALDSLDLVVSTRGNRCLVWPGDVSTRAGVRASDLVQAQHGSVTDSLRECARTDMAVATSCAEPHEVEWVGPWRPRVPDDSPADQCSRQTVEYTRMTVSGMENRIVASYAERTVQSRPEMRCLIRAEGLTLDGSLRNLRNGELPLT
jgi:hypothetical protein